MSTPKHPGTGPLLQVRSAPPSQGPTGGRPVLNVQWHITNRCGGRCLHCYMADGSDGAYSDSAGTLDPAGRLAVLHRLVQYEQQRDVDIQRLHITGGDPLLAEDWHGFLIRIKELDKQLTVMGVPETCRDGNLDRLAALELQGFQLSLDGLEQAHDRMRGSGSFEQTIAALERLHAVGIPGLVMFTLFPENAHDLIPLLRFLAEHTSAQAFTFDFGCSIGGASALRDGFTPEQVHQLLVDYIDEKDRLAAKGRPLRVVEKCNLLKLARYERDEVYPLETDLHPTISGCPVGWTTATIQADGTVLPCRRLPIVVGDLKDQPLEEIYLDSDLLKRFRRRASFTGCAGCRFYPICRGCPAHTHAATGSPFSPHLGCFAGQLSRDTSSTRGPEAEPGLDTNRDEEFELLCRRFRSPEVSELSWLVEDPELRHLFLALRSSRTERRTFRTDPHAYLAERGTRLTAEQLVLFVEFFGTAWVQSPGRTIPLAESLARWMLNATLDDLFAV